MGCVASSKQVEIDLSTSSSTKNQQPDADRHLLALQ